MKLFVYGTLKQGFNNHYIIENAPMIAKNTSIEGDMFSLGGFPGVVPGRGIVWGEIYDITEDQLKRTDRLEGHPTFYKRTPVVAGDDVKIECETYFYQGETRDLTKIKNGVWSPVQSR